MMRREFSSQQQAQQPQQPQQQQSQQPSHTPSSPTVSTSPILLRRNNNRRRTSRTLRSGPHQGSHHHAHNVKANALISRNPALAHKIKQMALPLSPLVQLTTGNVHPDFPATVLHFWLLTDAQLESLASFYHQAKPCPWTTQYPCPIRWKSDATLEEKRRRMGRFIGLRGCEAPVAAPAPVMMHQQQTLKTEEEIAREARQAALAADEEALRRKTGPWYR